MKVEYKLYISCLFALLMCYLLPVVSSAECIKGNCSNGEGTMIIADGIKYTGQWQDGLRHGRGLMTFSDGRKYLGDWKNDRPNGSGTMLFSDGGEYEGQFIDSLRHGQGTFVTPDGRKYVGEWQDDKPHGQGVMIFPDGHRYEGSWVMTSPQGKGVMNYPDGSLYEGFFANGVRHGRGFIIMPDGIRYEGTWDNDLPKGEAIIIYPGGERSSGYWQNGDFVRGAEIMPAGQDEQSVTAIGGDDFSSDKAEKVIVQMSFADKLAEQSENRTAADVPGMFPQGSVRRLTEADLSGKSSWELSIIRNEIFARHSYIFKTEPMKQYFGEQAWYKPRFNDIFFSLSEIEKLNIDYVLVFQRQGPTLTPDQEKKKGNTPMENVFASVKGDKVYIRSGPGKTHKAVSSVAVGYPLRVLNREGAWTRVEDFSARDGWIFTSMLSDLETVIVKVDAANMRTGPGTDYDVAAKNVARGTILRYGGREGDWLKVSSDSISSAWVYEALVWPDEFGR